MLKLVWDYSGLDVKIGEQTLIDGNWVTIDKIEDGMLKTRYIVGPAAVAAAHTIGAHWVEVPKLPTLEPAPEVRTMHSQTLYDFFREYRYAKVTTAGLGDVYTRALEHIEKETQIRVAEALKGNS